MDPRIRLLPHQWLLCAGLIGILCVPHAYWNNLYGVLFAAAVLILYRRDCAVLDMRPLSVSVLGLGVWVFLLMSVMCALWAAFPLDSLRVALFYLSGFTLSYVAAASFRERKTAEKLTGCIYAALVLTAIYGLVIYLVGKENYFVPMEGRLYPRLSSTMEHGINYSELVAMGLPLCLVWAAQRERRSERIAYMALLLFPLAALVLTYSRTGWIALGLALIILLWFWNKKLLIPAVLVAAAGLFLLPETIQARFLSILHVNDASASGRFTLWGECLAMLRRHWLTGVGLGPENFYNGYLPFATGLLDFQPPHANMGYLEIFLSTGIVGFAGFMWFFFGVFVRLGRALRRITDNRERWELYGLTASLTGAALANIPEHIWFYPRVLFFWCVLFGLAMGRTVAE